MNPPDFSTLTLDRKKPLQGQLHQQLTEWICIGRLPPGTKLASSRRLAEDLAISRNTVTQVLDQLRAEGFLTSSQGKGVFVSNSLPSHTSSPDSQSWLKQSGLPPISEFGKNLGDLSSPPRNELLPFTPGVPDLSAFPIKIWASLCRRHQDRRSLMGFDSEQGYTPLREALARYLQISRGVRCDADQIIVTNGAQQAISLCAHLTLNEGDQAIVENPGYHGARKAFLARHAKLSPILLRENFINVDALNSANPEAKILYTTPTHQYPLGGIMPASDRIRLLDWASNTNTWILEDDYDSEFCFNQRPVAALQGMAAETPVLYMGSFSKTLFPSLRIGYLVVPKELVGIFAKAKSFMTGDSSLLNQAVAADFISEGHFVRHLRRMRKLYNEKWQHLYALISDHLAPYAHPIGNSAGMHLVVETPGIDDGRLRNELHKKGFGSSSLSTYYIGEKTKSGLVLGFANTTMEQRRQCIEELSRLIR